MTRSLWPRLLLGVIALAAAVVAWSIVSDSSTFCDDVLALEHESESNFDDIRGELVNASTGEWSTSFFLDDAESCELFVDPERTSYGCDWAYEEAEQAQQAYESLLADVATCLGDPEAGEDKPVNHPDFWRSTFFATPGGDISISLKVKNTLNKVFVSLQVTQEQT